MWARFGGGIIDDLDGAADDVDFTNSRSLTINWDADNTIIGASLVNEDGSHIDTEFPADAMDIDPKSLQLCCIHAP